MFNCKLILLPVLIIVIVNAVDNPVTQSPKDKILMDKLLAVTSFSCLQWKEGDETECFYCIDQNEDECRRCIGGDTCECDCTCEKVGILYDFC